VPLGTPLQAVFHHEDRVKAVAFSPDGRRIASGARDRAIHVWDAESGQELACLRRHQDDVNCMEFSPDGRRLVSGGNDRTLRLWDTQTGED
jgi:WD40 repeat protein